MLSIAHRGCDGQYPENTVHAVRSTAPHVDVVEIDVRRCGSGELVVFHDEELDRVTGASGRVAETPWDRLRELDVFESGEPIPRFSEVLDAWPEGTAMNLDVTDPGVVPDALDRAADFGERILLSSVDTRAIEEVEASSADLVRGYSFTTDPEANVERARSLGCDFVHTHYQLCLETDLVEIAHDAGLRVDAWTVDSRETVERLRERGVDAVTVTRWDIL